MELNLSNKIGDVVAQDYRTAGVFQSFGIDFCCGGDRSLKTACSEKNLEPEKLLTELAISMEEGAGKQLEYGKWSLRLLTDYIEQNHHSYVEKQAAALKPLLQKLVKVHGVQHPELLEIEQLFLNTAGELTTHMKKEELLLFPFIRKMEQAKESGNKLATARFGSVENPVAMMQEEHDTEGERFRTISTLSNNYEPPTDGCTTYKATLAMLKEFETDLHLHIHLENNILFPKAMALEKELKANRMIE